MTSVFDVLNQEDPGKNTLLHAALAAGIDVLGQKETATFYPYIRTVLPIDGYVFWLRADLLSPQVLAQHGLTSAAPVTVNGTLHYATVGSQVEDETIVVRSVDLTAEQPIAAFAALDPDVMYVASWQTELGSFQFTFSRRNSFFLQASLWHYVSDAIYPAFAAQLINDVSQFDQRQVVSNSLPLFLAATSSVYSPVVGLNIPDTLAGVNFYPAFLVPENLVPAYGVFSIEPEATRAIASAPLYSPTMSRQQLCADRVRLTVYGLRNDEVMDLLDYLLQYSVTTGNFGIMNMPVVKDDRRPQVELAVLAQKKHIDLDINYFQSRARNVARQIIDSALLNVQVASFNLIPSEPIVPGAI